MATQVVPIHRTSTNSSSSNNKTEIWFNAFDYAPGQDENIRWLSRPNQQLVHERHIDDTEKFRITFDVENFQPDQIKICIQNHKLTITGVYEERTETRLVQKKFERNFDLPANADVDSVASFITSAHMLVVEIPLQTSTQVDRLNINSNQNDQRRLSFSLNKFNTSNNQGLLSPSNDVSGSSTAGEQVRRVSITKTTTKTTKTTTSSGSTDLPREAAELLKSTDMITGSNIQTGSTYTSEHHLSSTSNQKIDITEANRSSSTTTTKQTISTSSEISPELLASGGTITIQKRQVSVTKGVDSKTDQAVSIPITHSTDTQSTSTKTTNTTNNTDQAISIPITHSTDTQSTLTKTTNTTNNTDQAVSVPITRSTDTQSTSTKTINGTSNTSQNTLNQQKSSTSERRSSETMSTTNQSGKYTLEEFLQNKTWNPSLVDGPDGKKILYMRLQMKSGTTLDQMKISLNGYDLRIEVNNKISTDGHHYMSEYL
ncbi:unnamed protein product [Rotaria sp. Silwood2]|nr:unnamed protein product [Rotaria sp. Silwood2]CAF2720384.1 unnamed protein product [Rotaria sp. Silwood2]CAF2968941.1 unnamed protein product [Rotaria sp. Silwood2]CAF3106625.1 unnamed protein product [Rotaria sp. Silwood2]CAF3928709.1 unnamed protein product [Rotaria sp. Silwood2]